MSIVVSYLTKIYVNSLGLQYIPTEQFSVNGNVFKGVVIASSSPTTFIVTQRDDVVPFHNIQVCETQYVVAVQTPANLPAEIKKIVGNSATFLTTVNNVFNWYLVSTPVPSTQSDIDLLVTTNNIYITNAPNLFWSRTNNVLSYDSAALTFMFDSVTDSNIVVGSTSISGGGGGLTLVPAVVVGPPSFVPFSTVTGPIVSMNTNPNFTYNPSIEQLVVTSVDTNKIGSGPAPIGENISIGTNALLTSPGNSGDFNVAIGLNSLSANTTGDHNVAIGLNSSAINTVGSSNIAIGYYTANQNTSSNIIAIGYTALASNTSGADNLAIGYTALNTNTIGNNNVAIGNSALTTNTASNNVAIGHNCLTANTTGSSNIAIGPECLTVNQTGVLNIAIGNLALNSNVSGSANTAIGGGALESNTANSNTAIGFGSLNLNTSGLGNIAIGPNSLANNDTGNNNVAIGLNSLTTNVVGNANTAVGIRTLQFSVSDDNTAVGWEALIDNTIGADNTAFGKECLRGNQTGNDNTAVGKLALSTMTVGSNNIAIGKNSGIAYTTESDNILIGNSGTINDSQIIRIGDTAKLAAHIGPVIVRKLTPQTLGAVVNLTDTQLVGPNGGVLIGTATSSWTFTIGIATGLTNLLNPVIGDAFTFTVVNTSAIDTITLVAGDPNVDISTTYNTIGPKNTRVLTMYYTGIGWNLY
jgi:hypothetical protein